MGGKLLCVRKQPGSTRKWSAVRSLYPSYSTLVDYLLIMAALKTITLTRSGEVWVITSQVNAINPPFIADMHTALDLIEATPGSSALVFTSAKKIFSGGMDLSWPMKTPLEHREFTLIEPFSLLLKLMKRLLSLAIPTVAAIAGHCYAGGFVFACAFDHRVMSNTNATLCLNEITMPLAVHQTAVKLMQSKLPSGILRDMLLTGREVGPQEALARQIVDLLAAKELVLPTAVEFARSMANLGEKREAYGLLKGQMYGEVIEMCRKAAWKHEEIVDTLRLMAKL